MIRNMTCIVCPMGCTLEVTLDENGKFVSVAGNTCKRGEVYANNECTNPVRTLTSSVRCDNGEMLSVKTSEAVPKEKLFECMEEINKIIAKTPVTAGDCILKNICNTNVDVIATRSI
ncbi:MAG: DUF1667 domain-containing protein [Clostridia bacterium]|nr:DUF1667 domain-containing protein [Clostridia bacterium]